MGDTASTPGADSTSAVTHGTDCVTDGGRRVVYEETLALTDEAGPTDLIRFTRLAVLFMVLATLGSLVLVAYVASELFGAAIGGEVLRSIFEEAMSGQSLGLTVVVLAALFSVAFGLFLIVGFVLQLRGAFDQIIHVTVTERGVTVERENGWYWQPSTVDVPFDAITAVEYVDPGVSSLRTEPGDVRAPKFFAGRRQHWIRLDRDSDPAVYIGSDSHLDLADTIAERAPAVEKAEPY